MEDHTANTTESAITIERKWNGRWSEGRIFESDPDQREKRFITAAFPYPNSPQHIGHARTYSTADIYARFLRLKGYNVLFPMAFHVTGTPILAMAKRIAAKDKDVLDVFDRIYGISAAKAATLTEPRALVAYFSAEIEEGMKEMGFSIDWRRKFYSYDDKFNRFIQWQFRKLKELGFLIKGEYPIAWCPKDGNALSAHDTRGDVDPELDNVVVIKFEVAAGEYLVATTYRPETVYGVTNIWINPEVSYIRARSKGETIIIAEKAAEVLDHQLHLERLGAVKAQDLLKMEARNPIDGNKVPLFPARFVEAEIGTGIVMSVPAHAPLDYLALRDLGKNDLRMPQVVTLEGFGPAPAREMVEKMGVKDQDDPLAEKATEEVYTKEAHSGIMAIGEFKGERVSIAKEKVGERLKKDGKAFDIVTLSNGPVFCRCGAHAVVNIIKDQWFIDYGVPQWKAKAKECLNDMKAVPEKTRSEYLYTIDWFKTRPCTRASGLGTRFPFDETKMIEALSDSTLYMAYYSIAHMIKDMASNELDDAFFDAVLLGKGPRAKDKGLAKIRDSFLYWYPVDSRHSAGDLIRNHLTLYIFNHVALFEKRQWPRQIVTNGFVLMDGMKMSKSMGNILPLRRAIKEYGADVVRFSVVSGADLSTDTDFNRSVAEGVRTRLAVISRLVEESAKAPHAKPHSRIERWLLSRLNRKIERASELYSNLAMRELSLEIFYDVFGDLQWYMKRTQSPNLREFFKTWSILICPFMPHYAEECYEKLGGKGFASLAAFPRADESKIDDAVEQGEGIVKQVHADIEKISGLIGKKPRIVTLFVAAPWKRKLYQIAKANPSYEALMKAANAQRMPMKEVATVAKLVMKNVHAIPLVISEKDEHDALLDAKDFLAREYSCEVLVMKEDGTLQPKAKSALPNKPAILIE